MGTLKRALRLGVTILLSAAPLACDDSNAVTGGDAGVASDTGLRDVGSGNGLEDAAPGDAEARDAEVAASDGGLPDGGAPSSPDSGVLENPLADRGEPQLIQGGFQFLEGPTWRVADGVLLFSDIPADTIYRLTPPSTIDVFRNPSGKSNGLAPDPAGLLLAAEHGNRRISRTLADGQVVTVADRYNGLALNSPNDVVARSDGTLYFTDPPYGLEGRAREVMFNGVYRVSPAGVLTAEFEGDLASRPNGVGLSPREDVLYVSSSNPADPVLWAFDVAADGRLSNRRTFTNLTDFGDGLAIDDAGNVFVTGGAGVEVFGPDGRRWGAIPFPGRQVTNCAFGGPTRTTLYVTTGSELYQVPLTIPGGN